MKYLFSSILLVACYLHLQAQQDTTFLGEAEVLDTILFRKALGQRLIDVSDHPSINKLSTLSDLAFKTPLNISGNGAGLISNPILRGTHANGTQVFWNGMPVNSPTLGTSDLNLLPIGSVNEIQILPGGSGVELGSGAVGGSIFMNNALRFSKDPEHKIGLSGAAGSFGLKAVSGTYNYSNSKNSFTGGVNIQSAENNYPTETLWGEEYKMPNAGISRESINLAWQRRLRKTVFQTYALAQHIYRELPDARSGYNPHRPSEAYEDDHAFRWQNRLSGEGWTIEQGFNLEKQRYQDLRYAIDDTNNFFLSSTEIQKNLIRNNKMKWNVAGWFNYQSAQGSNINKSQVEYGLRSSFIYAFNPRFVAKAAMSMNFLDDNYLSYRSGITSDNQSGRFSGFPVLPSISAEYQLANWINLRAKAGMVYRMPTLNERYWPGSGIIDIDPENGFSSEIGYDLRLERKKFGIYHSATVYLLQLNNKVIWLPGERVHRPVNIDKTRSTGAELSARVKYEPITDIVLELHANANITRSIVIESERQESAIVGKQLVYVPEYTGGGAFHLGIKQLSFYLSGSYNSGAYPTSDNDEFLKLPAFVVLNTGLQYKLEFKKFHLSPRFDVYNFTDTRYELYQYRPNPGINYQISINSTFKL